MAEKPSNTANHQRLDEMLVHLTPVGARVPYSVSYDSESNIWVAAKGGLFKFDPTGKKLLWQEKYPFSKKVSPFCQILHYKDKMISAFAEEQTNLTDLKILDLNGNVLNQQFVDGKIQSLAVSETGDLFLLKRLQGEESIIYKADVDCPLGWEEVISDDEYAFQTLCVISPNLLLAATCSVPVNMYSKQSMQLIDIEKQKVIKKFSSKGKGDGEIYFPLAIRRYGDDVLILDKTGRIQQFTMDGSFVRVAAQIDAYLGNGFTVDGDSALLACSGIVLDQKNESICDDWLEKIKLDGSKWVPDVQVKVR